MAHHGYDLIDQPWIGVQRLDGTTARVGLAEALTEAHQLHGDLHGHTPTATAALWRVLAVLAYRVTGLDDQGPSAVDWNGRRDAARGLGRFDEDRVRAYLDRHRDRLDLFDRSRPWLQDPRLDPDDPARGGQGDRWSGLNKLLPGRPSDNSPAVWSPTPATAPDTVDTLVAIDGLLHTLWFSPGGQVGKRWSGPPNSPGRFGSNSAQPGPLRGRLSTHPTGHTLFDSLLAHLVPPAGYRHPAAAAADLAPWEGPLEDPSTAAACYDTGVVGRLTGFRHAVLLRHGPDTGTVADAVVAPRHLDKDYPDPVALDPYLPWRWATPKNGDPFPAPLQGSVERAVWRDLDAILADPAAPDAGSAAALTSARPTGVTVVIADQQRSQSRDTGWAVSRLPADLAAADPTARALVTAAVKSADRAAAELAATARRLAKPAGDDPADKGLAETGLTPAAAESAYWPRAEAVFTGNVDGILAATADPPRLFADTALAVFDALADRIDRLEHLPRLVAERSRLSRNLQKAIVSTGNPAKEGADAHTV